MVLVDQDVVRRDVAVQDLLVVNEADRAKHLFEDVLGLGRGQIGVRILDDVQQVTAADEIQRHIGGVVVLENLMHTDDVRVVQLGKAAGLLHEQADDRLQLVLVGARTGLNDSTAAPAERTRETFLDDDLPVQTVAGKVGDTKAAGIEETFDRVLAVHQLGAGLQLVDEVLLVIRVFYRLRLCHLKFQYLTDRY